MVYFYLNFIHLSKNLLIQNFRELSPVKEVLVNKNTTTVDDILQIVSQQENIEVIFFLFLIYINTITTKKIYIKKIKFLQIAKPIRFHLTEPAMIYGILFVFVFIYLLLSD